MKGSRSVGGWGTAAVSGAELPPGSGEQEREQEGDSGGVKRGGGGESGKRHWRQPKKKASGPQHLGLSFVCVPGRQTWGLCTELHPSLNSESWF